MKNPNILKVLREAVAEDRQERRSEKLFLIEGIVKVKKTLFAFGHTAHDEFKTPEAAGQLFDDLYEMEIEQLELINKGYEKQVNLHLSKSKITA